MIESFIKLINSNNRRKKIIFWPLVFHWFSVFKKALKQKVRPILHTYLHISKDSNVTHLLKVGMY